VKYGYRTLVDGGIVNTMPISCLQRKEGDILVAFDVNDIDVDSIRQYIINDVREEEERLAEEKMLAEETRSVIQAVKHDSNLSFIEKVKLAGAQGQKILSHKWNEEDDGQELFYEDNYYSILSRTFSIMNHVIAKEATERYRPDVLAKMPFDAYGEIGDYARAREISETGRQLMKAALDRYEGVSPTSSK
jgi:predicted acylesterase/phospholipase RssA